MPDPTLPTLDSVGNCQSFAVERIPEVTYKGHRVVTTATLAAAYGAGSKHIQDNFSNHAERFEEGKHFYRVVGAELRAFKNYPDNIGLVDPHARHLILWTAKGAARHAKILDTDEAWEVFEKLEDAYFEGAPAKVTRIGTAKEVAGVFRSYYGIARLIGCDRNQSALAANRAVVSEVGIDPLEALGIKALVAPQQAKDLTVTMLAEEMKVKSAIAMNQLLSERGYQVGKRDSRGRAYWEPTAKGQPFAIWKDTGKKHSNGTPVRQLFWAASLVPALQTDVAND